MGFNGTKNARYDSPFAFVDSALRMTQFPR